MQRLNVLIGILYIYFFCTVLALVPASSAPAIPASTPMRQVPNTSPPAVRKPTPEQVEAENWRKSMAQTQHGQGCFKAIYPGTDWQKVPCATTHAEPKSGVRPPDVPLIVGNGTAYVASVSGTMTTAIGSFGPIAGIVTESIQQTGAKDTYSVQMNTNTFSVTNFVDTAKNTFCAKTCVGWEQFVFETSAAGTNGTGYIEYWLFIGPQCPTSWSFVPATKMSAAGCKFDTAKVSTPVIPITDLGQLTLQGYVDPQGNDNVIVSNSKAMYATASVGSPFGLASKWNQTEFNVFGDLNARTALFNPGAVLGVTVKVTGQPGGLGAISCLSGGGTTAETTNLTLSGSCSSGAVGAWSQVNFGESTAPVITKISPTSGPEGGTKVDIFGSGFFTTNTQNSSVDNGTEIAFGSAFVGADCDSTTHCVVTTPNVSAPQHVFVTAVNYTSIDLSIPSTPNAMLVFDYKPFPSGFFEPNHGLPAGGTSTTLLGQNLATNPGGTKIDFHFSGGVTSALNISCFAAPTSGQECTMTTPPLTPPGQGPVAIPVTATANGLTNSVGTFTYNVPPPPPPRPPPRPICQCGSGQKCCPDPDGGIAGRCVAAAVQCPPLQ